MLIIQRPEIEAGEADGNVQSFTISPLEPGFGHTLGNSLRRTLLSSIPGAAVTQVRFDDALHEFDVIKGVKEDVTDVILNLKDLVLTCVSDEPVTLRLDKRGPVEVRRQHGARRVGLAVLTHEGRERGRAQQRGVARENDDVAILGVEVVGEGGEGHRGGVAGAAGNVLLDEVYDQMWRRLLLQGLRHPLGAVADNHHCPFHRQFRKGVEHVQQHRPAHEHVQRLRPGRVHPGALSSRQHHRSQRTVTAHVPVLPRDQHQRGEGLT